jgi:hypothetical protein
MNRMEKLWSDGAEIPVRAPTVVDGAWDWPGREAPGPSSSHQEVTQPTRPAFTT